MMARKECEAIITGMLEMIVRVYRQYNPDGKYLTMYYIQKEDGAHIHVNNSNWPEENGDPAGEDYILDKVIESYKKLGKFND